MSTVANKLLNQATMRCGEKPPEKPSVAHVAQFFKRGGAFFFLLLSFLYIYIYKLIQIHVILEQILKLTQSASLSMCLFVAIACVRLPARSRESADSGERCLLCQLGVWAGPRATLPSPKIPVLTPNPPPPTSAPNHWQSCHRVRCTSALQRPPVITTDTAGLLDSQSV